MKNKNWYQPKGYTHFDSKLSIEDAGFVNSYVSNPANIASHRFYPLIHRTIAEKKYKKIGKTPDGRTIRKHYKLKDGKRVTTAKYREIFYASHIDAHIYTYYTKKVLTPLYEKTIENVPGLKDSVIAYRTIPHEGLKRNKSNIDFAYDIFKIIENLKGEWTVLAFDITRFFDSLDHKKLKKKWYSLLGRIDLPPDHYRIYNSLINFSYVELSDLLKEFGISHPKKLVKNKSLVNFASGEEFRIRVKNKGYIKENPFRRKSDKSKVGIPQGTAISAFLANLYLLDYDTEILEYISEIKGYYRRYSDDILIIIPTEFAKQTEEYVLSQIEKYKIEIQKEKTQSSNFLDGKLLLNETPVMYLGFEFDGDIMRLKSASLAKYFRKLKKAIKSRAIRAKIAKKKNFNYGRIFRKEIYQGHSHLGAKGGKNSKRNYLSYAYMAAETMHDKRIKKQVSRHWKIIQREITRYNKKYKLKE